MEEDAERGNDIAKMESAAEAIKEAEDNTTDDLLRDAAHEDATGDKAAGHDLTELAKMESALEEANELAKEIYELTKAGMGEIEGAGPEEIPRDATQKDVTTDDLGGAIPDELLREPAGKEFAAGKTYKTADEDPEEPLRDTSAQEDATANETKGDSPEEMPRDTAGRKDSNDDDANGHDLRDITARDGFAADEELDESYELTKETYELFKFGLDEMGEIEATDPEESPRDTSGQEDATAMKLRATVQRRCLGTPPEERTSTVMMPVAMTSGTSPPRTMSPLMMTWRR